MKMPSRYLPNAYLLRRLHLIQAFLVIFATSFENLKKDISFLWKLNDSIMEFLKDLWQFLMARKKWWLVPIILVLLLIGGLLVLSSGSAVAPFIYSLF